MKQSIEAHREAFVLHPIRVLKGLVELREDHRRFTQQAQHDIGVLHKTMEYTYVVMDWADILKYDELWFQQHALETLRIISHMNEGIVKNPEGISDAIETVIVYLEEGATPSNDGRNEKNLERVRQALDM